MAYYPFNGDNSQESRNLRAGLDNLRSGLAALKRARDIMANATDAQVAERFGVYPSTSGGSDQVNQAIGLKAEVSSDLARLETNASQTGVLDAINQLLSKLG